MKALMKILLVEDDEGDIELAKIAFEEGQLPAELSIAHDGVEGLDCLFKRNKFADQLTPDLILLDLNMPKMDGKEFLRIVKQHPQMRNIPVIVFTSSSAYADIQATFKRNANYYITKPDSLEAYLAVARRVEDFWMGFTQPVHDTSVMH